MPRTKKIVEAPVEPVKRPASVISAVYKKVHIMDNLANEMSLLVRGGNPDDPVNPVLFGGLCRANNIDPGRWAGKNIGMQFMNLSNVLRSRQKRGEDVVLRVEEPKKRAPRKPKAVAIEASAEEVPAIAAE